MREPIRSSLSWLSGTRLATAAVRLLDQIPDSSRTALRVLTWHRVLPVNESVGRYPGVISTTPAEFARHAQLVRDRYNAVSIGEVLAALDGAHTLPKRAVLLTFDDAYTDFETYAFPILERMSLPVTLFVPTAYPDAPQRSFWWNRLYRAAVSTSRRDVIQIGTNECRLVTPQDRHQAGRHLIQAIRVMQHDDAMKEVERVCDELGGEQTGNDVLSWDALRDLAARGVSMAPHTRTHPLLNRLPLAEARSEVEGSIRDLKREIGDFAPVFAYPAGGFSVETTAMLRELDIRAAFTTVRGINDVRSTNRMILHRINVGRRANEAVIRWKLHRAGAKVLSVCKPVRPAIAQSG